MPGLAADMDDRSPAGARRLAGFDEPCELLLAAGDGGEPAGGRGVEASDRAGRRARRGGRRRARHALELLLAERLRHEPPVDEGSCVVSLMTTEPGAATV